MRCKRHALYVEDGVIRAFEVAEGPDDPAGDAKPDVTLAESMLSKVPDLVYGEKAATTTRVEEEKETDKAAAIDAINVADLVLFTKPACPFCKDAFESLQSSGFN